MKKNETDYLDKLFASSSNVADKAEADFPLVDVPQSLSNRLYAIPEPKVVPTAKPRVFERWPKVTSIAASLFVAIIGFQFYQQQQTLRQLEQAQTDLATALHYLGEANRIARTQVRSAVKEKLEKAGVTPAMKIEQESMSPDFSEFEQPTKEPTRTL